MYLKNIIGEEINLSKSSKFIEHSIMGHSYANILVQQINSGFYNKFFENKKDLIIYDIGGNIGLWSLFIRPICQNILYIEPTPSHIEIAKELFSIYDNPNKIYIAQGALANNDGIAKFNIGKINSTMNSLIKHQDHNESVEVKTFKLKTIINNFQHKVDFIKLDIEGGEQAVVMDKDFDEYIYNNVDSIFIEVHEGLGANFNQIWDKLSILNYKLEKINTDGIFCYK